MTVIVATGVSLAAADADDADHQACVGVLRDRGGELKVPAPVVSECAWRIERNLGPISEAAFLRLITSGQLEVVDLSLADYSGCIELIETYADLSLGLVDASVVTVGENFGVDVLAALNHRDFTVVPPRHIDAFELIP